MDLENLASQFIFPLAALLLISSIAKLIDLPKPKFLDFPINNKKLATINSITSNKILLFVLVIVEFILSALLIALGNIETPIRTTVIVLAAVLFILFSIWTTLLFFMKSGQPCLCFGALSKKKVNFSTVLRNYILSAMAIVAVFSEPARLTTSGLILTVIVLGVVLYEEIR